MKPTVSADGAGAAALAAAGALVLPGLAELDLLQAPATKRTRNESRYAPRETGAGEAERSMLAS